MEECQVSTSDKLNKILQDDCATEIEALVFGLWTDDGIFASIINALVAANEKLTNLKAIFIGDTKNSEWISPIAPSNLSRILEAYPNLEVLQVCGSNRYQEYVWLKFTPPLTHKNLKALIVESGGLSHQSINHICKLELPALEYLELWLGSDYYGGDSSISDLMPIISGAFPKLKYLGLRNSGYSNNIAFAIANSSIIENLVELDLSIGTLNDDGAKALLDCPVINSLDTLNISNNNVSNMMIQRLEQLEIEVVSD